MMKRTAIKRNALVVQPTSIDEWLVVTASAVLRLKSLLPTRQNNFVELLVLGLLFTVMLTACAGSAPEPEVSEPEVSPSAVPATEVPPTAVDPTPISTAENPPAETAEAEPTEDSPGETAEAEPAEEVQAAVDPQRGREIFYNGGSHEIYEPKFACVTCHSLDGTVGSEDTSGPSLMGIADRAAERVPGLTAEEYIRQSIEVPTAFLVPTYGNRMTKIGGEYLTDAELDDLIAFLLTLSGETVAAADIMPTPELDIDLGMQIEEGNPTRGKKLTAVALRCVACHDDEEITGFGPRFSSSDELPPIWERGELRIADPDYNGQASNNQEYLIESIFQPAIYFVPGEWVEMMPNAYHQYINEQELADILAWLKTFE